MRDIVGPGSAAVRLASEGAVLGRGLGGPVTAEVGCGERAEVAALGANGLDDHEVLGGPVGVDLHGLEEVVLGVGHDGHKVCAEVTGEVADWHACTVDLAVVAAEEEVHVLRVADDGLVDRAGVRAGDLAAEERLHGAPAVGVAGVGRRAVREGGGAPLVR